jgi:thiol-disulfide isomerase/thioredoxin
MSRTLNPAWLLVCLTLVAFAGLATATAEDEAKPAVATTEQGDRLEVLAFDPPLPAELRPGQRLTVRVAYELQSGESALIFVRPMTDGKRSAGYGAHASPGYRKGKGQMEGWFTFSKPTVIDQVQVTLVTDRAKDPALELLATADAKWAGEPIAAAPAAPTKPRTELEALQQRLQSVAELEPAKRRELLEQAQALVKKSELGRAEFSFALGACRSFERADPELGAAAYESFAELFASSKDPQILGYVEKLRGAARRSRLVGNPVEVFGKTVDGESFEWKAYDGKVVLIDFWATWCGPCIAELPNVKKQYELYRDQGFDVVGVSLDQDKARLVEFIEQREIPWTNLFSDDPEKTGWNHPLATHYGIMAIPATILVNQQGQVVSLSARGAELPKLLEELLGKPKE